MQFSIWQPSCFLAAIFNFTTILMQYVIFGISWDGIYEMMTHTGSLFLRNNCIHCDTCQNLLFGSHFVLGRYLKMLNADRVSAVGFLKLMFL